MQEPASDPDLASEPLFANRLVVAAGAHGRLGASPQDRPRGFGGRALGPDAPRMLDTFRRHGRFSSAQPADSAISLMTYSMPLRMSLAASGYITAFRDRSGR